MTGTVRRSGSSMYLNMKQPDSDTPIGWVWARIELDGQKALVWPPDVEQFTTAVNEQVLPGTVQ